jgi:hypothetical protein
MLADKLVELEVGRFDWNIAECEQSVLGRQRLARRIDSQQLLNAEVAAWQQPRNAATVGVDWQFRTADARIKLKRYIPR